jgi:triacylglycerol lipase
VLIPKLKAPIVLVHGLFGVSQIRLGGMRLFQYFAGIPEVLSRSGNQVLVPSLSPVGSVAERAQQLKDFLDQEVPQDGVHIFAHSMGGLDARYMISRLGMDKRVISLTTLGTPHRGTAFADWGIARLSFLVQPVLDLFGIPAPAFNDLTRASCRAFNEQVPDAPGVRYFSVAASHDGAAYPEWSIPYNIVFKEEGPNDGVVSVESAKYGSVIDVWDGDHFSLINWSGPFRYARATSALDHRYGPLLRRLADENM